MSNILLSIVWFSTLYIGTFLFFRKRNLFSPIKFICTLFILRNLTYLIVIYFDESVFPDYILRSIDLDLDSAILQYTYVQTIAFFSLISGILIIRTKHIKNKIIVIRDYKTLVKSSKFIFVIGLLSYLIFIINIGGLFFLLSNLENRIEFQSGAYILIFTQLLSIAIIFRVRIYGLIKSKKNKILFILFFLTAIFLNSSLGGRRGSVFIILISLASYNYFIKPIRFSTIKRTRMILIVAFS